MSRRAVIKRAKIRRGRLMPLDCLLMSYGLRRMPAKLPRWVPIKDFEPSAEEKGTADAFFADADKWGGSISEDMRAHLVSEGKIFDGESS